MITDHAHEQSDRVWRLARKRPDLKLTEKRQVTLLLKIAPELERNEAKVLMHGRGDIGFWNMQGGWGGEGMY